MLRIIGLVQELQDLHYVGYSVVEVQRLGYSLLAGKMEKSLVVKIYLHWFSKISMP